MKHILRQSGGKLAMKRFTAVPRHDGLLLAKSNEIKMKDDRNSVLCSKSFRKIAIAHAKINSPRSVSVITFAQHAEGLILL